jgi:hypothetical protein
MEIQKFLEVLADTVRNIFVAERSFPTGAGEKKQRFVMDTIKPLLDVPNSPPLSEIGDASELLRTIAQLVSLVVKLLNILGVFSTSSAPGRNAPPP